MLIEARHSRVAALVLIPLLVAFAIYFRLPFLLNPAILNSDAAVVGLQGRHILQGEWSPFLWAAGYQASFEPTVAALLFKFMGATPLALMWVPLSGFLILLSLAFLILCRYLGWLKALFLSMLFVICPPIMNHNTIMSSRQWCITFVFLAFFFLDCAAHSRRSRSLLFAGAFSAFFAAYLDFFALQFLPGILLFGWLAASQNDSDYYLRRQTRKAFLTGIAAGIVFLGAIRLVSPGAGSAASFSFKMIAKNWPMLWKTCMPIAVGTEFFVPGGNLYSQVVNPSLKILSLQWLGVTSLVTCLAASFFSLFSGRVSPGAKRWGAVGFVVILCTLVGFLGSKMVSDLYSARYLAPIFWILPFSLMPLASRLRPAMMVPAVLPFLALTATVVWMGQADRIQGGRPVRVASGQAVDELELVKVLRQRGIRVAVAQYWLAYRLSFLFEENPIVTPQDRGATRYGPYLAAADAAPMLAHIFHPSEPRDKPEDEEARLLAQQIPFQKFDVAGYTVFIKYLKGSSLGE